MVTWSRERRFSRRTGWESVGTRICLQKDFVLEYCCNMNIVQKIEKAVFFMYVCYAEYLPENLALRTCMQTNLVFAVLPDLYGETWSFY